MKYLVNSLRVLVGLVFIFSGFIKSNDPTGFSYKLDEYFTVFADDLSPKPDSITVHYESLDGKEETTLPIPADVKHLNFAVINSPWTAVEIDEETTMLMSQSVIQCGGQIIKEIELSAQDSGELVYSVKIDITHDNASLHKADIQYIAMSDASAATSLDVEAFQKGKGWHISLLQAAREYVIPLAMIICVIEIFLGFALVIGWAPKFTLLLYLLMLIFFAFLTWYSAAFDKVTDCGCFGDAIKLTPWESFNKDLILLVSTMILWFGKKHIHPFFSNPFSVRFLTVISLLSTSFTIYCWHYLPVKNFLYFKEGADIKQQMQVPEGGRETDHIVREYIYDNNGEQVTVVWDSDDNSFTPNIDGAWTYIDVGQEKTLEKRDDPPIHDFKIMDESLNNDYVEEFFSKDRFKLLVVMNDLGKTKVKSIAKLKTLFADWKAEGHAIYILTASDATTVEAFRHEHQIDIPFYYGDKTNLKSIIRSNPGLVMVDGTKVVRTWPSTRLPKSKKLLKLAK